MDRGSWIVDRGLRSCGIAVVVEVVELVDLSGHDGVLAVMGSFGFGGCFRCVCICMFYWGDARRGVNHTESGEGGGEEKEGSVVVEYCRVLSFFRWL